MAVASEASVLVSTEGLSEKDWLEYRRRGIGGSDAAAILRISPFATARDLYYDKLKIVPFDDSESNWVAKKMGHLLEDLVAEIFHVKTGYQIYQIKKMFYHPVHTFMLADIDYFVALPGERTAILEIKTTNYNAKDHWWSEDGQEIVPLNYEAQGRHYKLLMPLPEDTRLFMGQHQLSYAPEYRMDRSGNLYMYLACLEAAVEAEGVFACNEEDQPPAFSAACEGTRFLPVYTYEEAVEKLEVLLTSC